MELPIEVYEDVIDQASDDSASLRDLSLTCATFLPRSRYHLFSMIRIRTVEQMESSRDFLDAHPWLLPLVHEVTLSFQVPRDYDKRNVRVIDVVPVHLLTRLPNLRSWRIFSSNTMSSLSLHRSVLSLYSRCSSRIPSLDLYFIRFYRLSDFIRLVSAFTSIHTLTCSVIMIRQEEERSPSLYVGGAGMLARPLQVSTLIVSL